MKNQRNLIALAAVALLACSASTVRADTIYDWSYTGTGVSASGTLTTSGALTALTGYHYTTTMYGYDIIGITGQRNGVNITGIVPDTHFPNTTVIGSMEIDDALLPNGSGGFMLDIEGLGYYVGADYYTVSANGSWGGSPYQQLAYGGGYAEVTDSQYMHGIGLGNSLTITEAAVVPDGGMTVTLLGGALMGLAAFRRKLFF